MSQDSGHPLSPTAQGFDALDLQSLARATTKTFDRLAPFSQLRDPSSHDARPTVLKTVDKIKSYLAAIDTSIQVVHAAYQMSKIASLLCSTPLPLPLPVPDKSKEEKERERQRHLEEMAVLSDAACDKAHKASEVFKQVQQDFYRIAASTKDMDATVQLPVDPALLKTLKKPLKDIGSDLVANLSLLAHFSRHLSDLASWCAGVKAGVAAMDGSVVPTGTTEAEAEGEALRGKWERVRGDCLVYHSMISEMQGRYAAMLPLSTELWEGALRDANANAKHDDVIHERSGASAGREDAQAGGGRWKMSNLFRDVVRHLGCHACM
ncbi:hypothetical protein FPV67DRAFT_254804 [Lyophyllum atratum]|nr:hypothetical protein FPV67DRAFT_254804 [Lyophyllum atratum]